MCHHQLFNFYHCRTLFAICVWSRMMASNRDMNARIFVSPVFNWHQHGARSSVSFDLWLRQLVATSSGDTNEKLNQSHILEGFFDFDICCCSFFFSWFHWLLLSAIISIVVIVVISMITSGKIQMAIYNEAFKALMLIVHTRTPSCCFILRNNMKMCLRYSCICIQTARHCVCDRIFSLRSLPR